MRNDNITHTSGSEKEKRAEFLSLLKSTPLPDAELLDNIGLYLTSKTFSRLLFFYELYKKVVNHHGVIMEFGMRWGQTVNTLIILRSIFEPYNRIRKIIGFDTFSGLFGVDDKDGRLASDGRYAVSDGYFEYINKLLELQEGLNPLSHIKKFEVVKGDVCRTLPDYLKKHPETVISMAVFDMDIYKPTKKSLSLIKPYLTKGSLLVFDELCDEIFPGETEALREVFEPLSFRLRRLPITSRLSYFEVE